MGAADFGAKTYAVYRTNQYPIFKCSKITYLMLGILMSELAI